MEYKDTEHTGNKGNTRKTGFKGKKNIGNTGNTKYIGNTVDVY